MRSRNLFVPVVLAFLLVAGIGATTSYLRQPRPEATGNAMSASWSRSGLDGETLARLTEYTGSPGNEQPASLAPAGKQLPDVDTMIERLVVRLKSTPEDVKGWRMLGWSYFHTGRYEQATAAYARAVELDPNSAEIKVANAEAKANATGSASSLPTAATGNGGGRQRDAKTARPEAAPPHESDAAIRSMVDGLAGRLETSPRDVEGWTRLLRSRVVLGEREVAAAAFRKALEVFKDDSGASDRIAAAAAELGLKAQ
jgi:cytochrome c-type biogenesis protein CcmH